MAERKTAAQCECECARYGAIWYCQLDSGHAGNHRWPLAMYQAEHDAAIRAETEAATVERVCRIITMVDYVGHDQDELADVIRREFGGE